MRKLKITSLILVVVMLVGMLPMGIFSFSASAAVTKPTTVPTTLGENVSYFSMSVTKATPEYGLRSTDAIGSISSNLGGLWRDAQGIMVKVSTGDKVAQFVVQIQINGGGFGTGSYGRLTTPNYWADMTASKIGTWKSDAYLYDGTEWTKQSLNNKSMDNAWVTVPANFEGYLYVPFDQMYVMANGNRGSMTSEKDFAYDWNAIEYLSYYNNPKLNGIAFQMNEANTVTVTGSEVVFKAVTEDLSPKEGWTTEDFKWQALSTEGAKIKLDATYHGNETKATKGIGDKIVFSSVIAGNRIGTGTWASSEIPVDASKWTGYSMMVDASGQPSNRLRLRPWLQTHSNFRHSEYANGMILQSSATGNYADHSATESFMQFVCDVPTSVGYYRWENETTWTAMMPICTADVGTEGYYLLPAGFKGEVYVPMESCWMPHVNNSGAIVLPFDKAPSYDVCAWGGFTTWDSDVTGSSAFTLSGMKAWYSSDTVEIGTAEELLNFFNNLNEYAGKKVILTNDIAVNDYADWKATSGTAPAVKLANRTAANNYFSGTFDGQGHVISGLYLESNITSLGLFGVVDHKTQATVKNVTILNSVVKNTCTTGPNNYEVGMFLSAGAIFGQVMSDLTEAQTHIAYNNYINKTKAIIKNVYCDVQVIVPANVSGAVGAGGFVGILQSDLEITASTFAGSVTSGLRGTAYCVGAIYPPQRSAFDHDGDGANTAFYPNDTNKDGVTNNKDAAVYYKNNNAENGIGTGPISMNVCEVNLWVDGSIFTGTLKNTKQGFVGGIVGYNNIERANVRVSNCLMTGSIANAGSYTGYILGGSWASATAEHLVIGAGATEWQDYIIYNYMVVDNDTDACSDGFGKTTGAIKLWAGNTPAKYKNSVADATAAVTKVASTALPTVIKSNAYYEQRYSVTLEEDLAIAVKVPVGSIILAPDVDIASVLSAQIDGVAYTASTAKLSDDGMYWEVVVDGILPQDAADVAPSLKIDWTLSDTVKQLSYGPFNQSRSSTNNYWAVNKATAVDYLEAIVADDTADATLVALAADTLRYVAATQEYFGDLYTGTKVDTTDLPEGAGNTADDIADESYLPEVEGNTFTYIALQLEGKLAVRIGVTGGTYTATVNGNAAEVVAGEDYILVYFDVADGMYELNVTDATGDNTLFYEYLSDYICVALTMDGVAGGVTENVLVALYNYIYSADVYANS